MKNIAILASGSGTNAENIIKYFSTGKNGKVVLVLSDRREAYVLKRAANLGVESIFFERDDFYHSGKVLRLLADHSIDFIVLAGFLILVPGDLISVYKGRIINIHPALLPKYGGKGMYGERVHAAVLANKETESGITIHFVNECYDEGDIIFQAKCDVLPGDTPETLAARIHALEYAHFPEVIRELLEKIPGRSESR
jgi:phosphoribosylglycinamide formyltransferase 1